MGVALLRIAPERGRRIAALLVGASLAADIGWCVLTLVGVEGGHSLGSQTFHAPRLPWSHSLLSTAVLALASAAVGLAIAERAARAHIALLAAAAVALHWLAGDMPFGEAFPLTPWGAPLRTPHIYANWPTAFAIETVVVAGGVAAAAPVLGRRRAAILTVVLLALHVAAWLPSFAAQPPVDLDQDPVRILAYLVLLLAAGTACVAATPP